MPTEVAIYLSDGTAKNGLIWEDPDCCPECNHAGEPVLLFKAAYMVGRFNLGGIARSFYRCSRHDCGAAFVASFGCIPESNRVNMHFMATFPVLEKLPPIPDKVASLSSQFVEIFNQAYRAKQEGLDQLFGMGLRKALEFLIKDYCLSLDPANDTIRSKQLGPVINEHISNSNIKACAARATWLGNDETHYERRWDAHDVTDMEALMGLTMSWIQAELLTAEYLKSMPPPKKAGAS